MTDEEKLSETDLILRVQKYMAIEAEYDAISAMLSPLEKRRRELVDALTEARMQLGEYTYQHGQQIVIVDGTGAALLIPANGRGYAPRAEVYPSRVGVVSATPQ